MAVTSLSAYGSAPTRWTSGRRHSGTTLVPRPPEVVAGEIVAVELDGDEDREAVLLVIHVMPTHL